MKPSGSFKGTGNACWPARCPMPSNYEGKPTHHLAVKENKDKEMQIFKKNSIFHYTVRTDKSTL